ncbi:Chemotaxis protein CheW [bioreactor metagenome]|uniref:Chemotaxis protein CheW n=1 Tax=bioreactor metagenome TaxID=1076179 RepID=A0A644T1P4_9ZZZZ|nr:chemotaxis protein CheW [Negativicutes bacterium]
MSEKTYADGEVQLVVFKLGREEYGIGILQVQEIKRMTDITRVPHTPQYIKGVINLRGSVLPVLDLRKRLNLPAQDDCDATRIIIVKVEDITVGMIVDSVSEVTALNQDHIELPSTVVGGVAANYLSGVGKQDDRLLILLNLNEIIGTGQDNKAS